MTDMVAPEFSMDAIAEADKAASSAPDGTPIPAAPAPVPAAPVEESPKPTALTAPEFSPQAIAEADRSWQAEDTMALRSHLMQASQQNPDTTAKALPIAQNLNLPVPTVANNLPMLTREQQFTHDYVENLQKQAPKTAEWLKNPTNAALAHDDINSLAQIEGMSQMAKMLDVAALAQYNLFQVAKYGMASALGDDQMKDDARANLALSRSLVANNVLYSDDLEAHQIKPDFTSSPVKGFLYDAAQGTLDMAPALLAAVPTGGAALIGTPLAALPALGIQIGGGESGEILGRGGSGLEATGGGLAAGTIASVMGPIIGGPLAGLLGKTPLPEWAVNTLAHGAVPMAAMNVGTGAVDTAIANPNKTWGQYFDELPASAATGFAQGILFHAGTKTLGAAHDAAMSRFSAKYAAAKAAADTAPILQGFNDVAAASPLRSRSPDTFNTFLQSATEDSPIHTLYVEPAAMEKAGVTADQLATALPHLADDIADAANNGFAVKIPAADFGTSLAGTPMGDALLPHLKTDPNGMSLTESEDFVKSGAAKEFESEMTKAAVDHNNAAEFDASAKRVEDQIKANYAATGRFPNDVNASTARLGAFYKVLAHSYGITPEEAFARHGATITGTDMVPGGEAFDGTKAPPAAKPEKVAKAEPEPAAKTPKPVVAPEIDSGLKSLRTKAEVSKNTTKPLLKYLKKAGIHPESTDAADLRNMGITNKTMPGLFKRKIFDKKTGIERDVAQGLDNIPHDELRAALGDAGPNRADLNGYVDRQWLLDKIEAEHKLGANADLDTQRSPEDENAANIAAEIQHYGLDLKKMDDATLKKKILAGRAKDALMESKAMGQELTPAGAREVANLMGQGYDIQEAIDSVAERADLEALKEYGSALGYDHLPEIPFPDLPAPADAGAKGAGDSGFPGDDGTSRPADESAAGPGDETTAGQTDSALLDEAYGLKESDFIDEQGRAIDKPDDGEFFQAAYHGTPHHFDKFTLDHIGNGEGNQAYGWGLYFAGNKKVAEYYRNALTGRDRLVSGSGERFEPRSEAERHSLDYLKPYMEFSDSIGDAIKAQEMALKKARLSNLMLRGEEREKAVRSQKRRMENIAIWKKIKADGFDFRKDKGQVYEVDIPDDHNLLDWDKPLSQQPEGVRAGLEKLGIVADKEGVAKYDDSLLDALQNDGNTKLPKSPDDPTGEELYRRIIAKAARERRAMEDRYGDDVWGRADKLASMLLHDAGIPGLRYFDGSSRKQGEGHHNYVIFDDNAINVLDRFYQADKPGRDNANASYNPTTQEIWLGKNANLTSMLHEEGHHFLNVYTRLAAEPGAPERVRQIADGALQGLGVEGKTPEDRLAAWHDMSVREQARHHEPWARGFERYLFRGKAPSIAMQNAFDAFRGWLKHTYGSIKDFVRMHPEAGSLNEELRGVMDRMLATDAEIEYARQVRNFEPLFKSAEEGGMTPDEYRSYQNLGQQSFQDASAELQGRSLRDMTLTRKMHEKTVKALNKDALEKRKAVQEEVTQAVLNEPVNRARNFLKTGTLDGVQRRGVHRLDIDDVKRMYGDDAAGLMDKLEGKFGKFGILAKGGLHPDEVAPAFGFETGRDMIQAMVDQPNVKDRIAQLTDQTVLERYGDLRDAQAIARRADQAVHNDARIRSVATELNAVRKAIGKSKIMNDAAKEYARQMIARQKVGEIDPSRYANAAAKAAKTALEAMGKGKLDEVAEAKRNQLVNEHATKLAYEALDRIEKIRNNARRYDKESVRKSIGTDIEQIDAILDQYDMRRSAVQRTTSRTQSLLDWYNSQIEAGYEPMIDEEIINKAANPDQKTHYADLTMDQLRGVDVAVRTVERTAKNRKEIIKDGKKVALNTVVGELVDRMNERPEKFSAEDILNKPRAGIDPIGQVFLDRLQSKLRAGIVSLTPQDFRANKYDLHEIGGPFHRYIFDKFFDRNYWKQDTLTSISKSFEAKVKELGDGWQKSLYDLVPNKMLIDKAASTGMREDPITGKVTYDNPVYRRLTRGDLIGIARHVGNESNFMKMAKGMGWEPADIWRFLDTNMRAADWKAVQAEWDAFERFWPESEAMVRRLGGIVPEKIPLRPFETQFGMMKGGYAPIDYDPIRSELSKRLTDGKLDPTESIGQKDVYKATTTMNSSLRNRIEGYSDIVNLDYHYMTRRLHETIHDLAYREAILDAKKIMSHPDFRANFEQTFGPEEYQSLQQFVTNVQEMYKRDQAMDNFEKVIQYTRQGVVMTGVAYRITTVLKHGSSAGLKSLGFLEGSGKKYLMARANRMATGNLQADIADARAKFPEINARLARMDRDFSAGEHSLYDPDTWKEKNNRMGHAMVAWSDALTAIPTAHAAYDWAITEGVPKKFGGTGQPMSHEEAVRFANGVVRQAHGSAIESARSNFLHEKGMASLLGMIYQFQNNTFGQYVDIIDKYRAEASRYTSNPALAGRIMATLIAPAVVTYLVSHKGLTDDPWFEQLGLAIADEIASTVPGIRDGWGMAVAMIEGRQANGAELPPIRVAGDVLKSFKDVWQELHGKQSKILQDAGNAIGEVFHIGGLGQAGKTAQYVRDVHNGKQNPKSIPAAIVGAAIGPPPKHQGHPSKPGSVGDFFGGGAFAHRGDKPPE